MNDVIGVALISGGLGLLGGSVGALTTYKVNQRNTETTIATANSQKEIELAKIDAENRRLQLQHAEEERRNRQSAYHRTIAILQRIYGLDWASEESDAVWEEWRYCRSGVQIFGSPKAFDAVDRVQDVIQQKPEDDEDHSSWDEDFKTAAYALIEVVREDVRATNDEARALNAKATSARPAAS